MSAALKCDFCKKLFQIRSNRIPNVLTFAKIEVGDELNLEYDSQFVPNEKIIKNECSNSHGTRLFNMCEQCYKKIENLIIDDGGTDESFV